VEMGGSAVDESAVAVEDEGVEGAFGEGDWHRFILRTIDHPRFFSEPFPIQDG
jgi:hypothetical protein